MTLAQDRAHEYRIAARSRLLVFLILTPILFTTSMPLSQGFPIATGLAAVSSLAVGLSPAWYFIGLGDPSRILLIETIPRMAFAVVGAALVASGFPLMTGPLALLVGALSATAIASAVVRTRSGRPARISRTTIVTAFRTQRSAVASRIFSAIYMGFSVAIVAIFAPGSVAAFAAAERLFRLVLSVLQSVPNSMQHFVGRAGRGDLNSVLTMGVAISVFTGTVGGAALIAFGPMAERVLFQGSISLDRSAYWLSAIIVLLTCTSRGTGGLALIRLGGMRYIAFSSAIGAIVGLPVIAALSMLQDVTGALFGVIVAESLVLAVQVVGIIRLRRA
ncbi:hypothetical protein [Georgenia muralis]